MEPPTFGQNVVLSWPTKRNVWSPISHRIDRPHRTLTATWSALAITHRNTRRDSQSATPPAIRDTASAFISFRAA